MPNCVALNCNHRFEKGYRLFRFPTDKTRRAIWTQNIRREDSWYPTKDSRICEVHFEYTQFENHRADGVRKLKPNAVPTLFNFDSPYQPPRFTFCSTNTLNQKSHKNSFKLSSPIISQTRKCFRKYSSADGFRKTDNQLISQFRTKVGEEQALVKKQDPLLNVGLMQHPFEKVKVELSDFEKEDLPDQERKELQHQVKEELQDPERDIQKDREKDELQDRINALEAIIFCIDEDKTNLQEQVHRRNVEISALRKENELLRKKNKQLNSLKNRKVKMYTLCE